MNSQVQRVCAWCGPVMTVVFFIGFIPLARFIPPVPPTADAATVAAMYRDNAVNIRLGMFLVLIVSGLFLGFGVAIAAQTRRIEARSQPIMTYLQLSAMAVCAVVDMLCTIFWQAAAFRPDDTSPDVTRVLNDLGWFTFVFPWVPFSVWCLAIAVPIMQDRSVVPVYPRWVGYLNIWTAISFVPAGIIVFTKTGPLAWNGILALYLPLFMFFGWVVAMSVTTFKAIANQNPAESHPLIAQREPTGSAGTNSPSTHR